MATGVSARREPGTAGLKCVKEYFHELSHAFKCDLETADGGDGARGWTRTSRLSPGPGGGG